jgi:hypothetical protein
MKELVRDAPRRGTYRVYFVNRGTAVYLGWRPSSIDVNLRSDQEVVFRNIQKIKERLNVNIEFARPEDFVSPLKRTTDRNVFIDTIGKVSFYHYDPYAQLLSKVVRGFKQDLEDAKNFIDSGMVAPNRFRSLVAENPESIYVKYPTLSKNGIDNAVELFLSEQS